MVMYSPGRLPIWQLLWQWLLTGAGTCSSFCPERLKTCEFRRKAACSMTLISRERFSGVLLNICPRVWTSVRKRRVCILILHHCPRIQHSSLLKFVHSLYFLSCLLTSFVFCSLCFALALCLPLRLSRFVPYASRLPSAFHFAFCISP